jgi:hypothetical protein
VLNRRDEFECSRQSQRRKVQDTHLCATTSGRIGPDVTLSPLHQHFAPLCRIHPRHRFCHQPVSSALQINILRELVRPRRPVGFWLPQV